MKEDVTRYIILCRECGEAYLNGDWHECEEKYPEEPAIKTEWDDGELAL